MAMPLIKFGNKSVGALETSVTITFANDSDGASPSAFPAGYNVRVVVLPIDPWATSVRTEVATNTQAVVHFGSAPGGYGGSFDWIAIGR